MRFWNSRNVDKKIMEIIEKNNLILQILKQYPYRHQEIY